MPPRSASVPTPAPRIVPYAVVAKSAARVDVDAAFAERDRHTGQGFFGPTIGGHVPIVYIPMAAGAAPVGDVELLRRMARFRTATPVVDCRPWIRSQRYAIGGYAARFNATSRGRAPFRIAPGAFRDAIAAGHVYLLMNHPDAGEGPSLASMMAGTLHAEEDARGLWFEAALPADRRGAKVYDLVRSGQATGVSWGAVGLRRGDCAVETLTAIGLWEISLITPPHQPRFPQAWAMPNEAARMRRRVERLAT